MKNLDYRKRQFQLAALRAQWWLTSAASGYYKQRKIFHGTVSDNGPEFTDEEKLADAMATALRHLELAAEFSEGLAEDECTAEAELLRRPA